MLRVKVFCPWHYGTLRYCDTYNRNHSLVELLTLSSVKLATTSQQLMVNGLTLYR